MNWISVHDKIPERSKKVQATDGEHFFEGFFYISAHANTETPIFIDTEDSQSIIYNITHWREKSNGTKN